MYITENLKFSCGKLQFFNDHVVVKMYPREEAKHQEKPPLLTCLG